MVYTNSSNFWWILCFLFCLHSYVYLFKIFISLSIYEITIINYFLDTKKYQNTFFKCFLYLKQNWRETKGVVPALFVNLVCFWLHCYGNYFLWPFHHFPILKCLYAVSSNDKRKLFLVVPGRRMSDNSHKLIEWCSFQMKKKINGKPKQNWKKYPNTLRVIKD